MQLLRMASALGRAQRLEIRFQNMCFLTNDQTNDQLKSLLHSGLEFLCKLTIFSIRKLAFSRFLILKLNFASSFLNFMRY